MYFSFISKHLLAKSHRISKHIVKFFWILAFASHTTHVTKENQCGGLPAISSRMKDWEPPEKNSSWLCIRDLSIGTEELWGHLAYRLPSLPGFTLSPGYSSTKHKLVNLLSKYVGLTACSWYHLLIQQYKIYNMEKEPWKAIWLFIFSVCFYFIFFPTCRIKGILLPIQEEK